MRTETVICDRCNEEIAKTKPRFTVDVKRYASFQRECFDYCGYCVVKHLGMRVSGPRRKANK